MKDRKGKLPGLKILLEGEPGTGKTYAIRSAFAAGLNVRVIFNEQSQTTLADLPFAGEKTVQWHYIQPPAVNWNALNEVFLKVNTLSNASLQSDAIGQREQRQFMEVVTSCNDFVSDRDGKSYGDISTWGTDTLFVIDGLSSLTTSAIRLSVGYKPILTQPDWGVVQNTLRLLLQPLTENLFCHFLLIAHIDREIDEVRGGTRKVPATAGRKLAPRIPEMFGEAIMAYRKDAKFLWRTFGDDDAMIKGRVLGLINDQPADFRILLEAWKKAGGVIEA